MIGQGESQQKPPKKWMGLVQVLLLGNRLFESLYRIWKWPEFFNTSHCIYRKLSELNGVHSNIELFDAIVANLWISEVLKKSIIFRGPSTKNCCRQDRMVCFRTRTRIAFLSWMSMYSKILYRFYLLDTFFVWKSSITPVEGFFRTTKFKGSESAQLSIINPEDLPNQFPLRSANEEQGKNLGLRFLDKTTASKVLAKIAVILETRPTILARHLKQKSFRNAWPSISGKLVPWNFFRRKMCRDDDEA